MTEKQKYLLKLFQEVDEICKEHNLRYVMAGGSLVMDYNVPLLYFHSSQQLPYLPESAYHIQLHLV